MRSFWTNCVSELTKTRRKVVKRIQMQILVWNSHHSKDWKAFNVFYELYVKKSTREQNANSVKKLKQTLNVIRNQIDDFNNRLSMK